ncbi:MAG: SGNH/GDSL hydrolase family protein [Pseudomonadales bacterium]|nr:SGNH/GDSL hydrolase family protein [Pseudomonadales bacterium]
MNETSNKSLQSIANFFLILSVLLLCVIALLIFDIVRSSSENDLLKANLLNQNEIQEVLMAAQPSEFAIYPHITKEIGFVLNPFMKFATWKAAEGDEYRINSIGLRGSEIHHKNEGVKRILLVGDSVIFGWKLLEEDKISSQMQAIAKRRFPDQKIEFVTVALPGWNKIDEYHFLASHLELLAPDVVIWSLLRNDVNDTGSPIPPGNLALWNSVQRKGNTNFNTKAEYQKDLPMPIIRNRWDTNLNLISHFEEKYQIPVVLLWWWGGEQRAFFDDLLKRNQFKLPFTVVPSTFLDDKAFWCIAENDCHPTKKATHVVAIGLWDSLARNKLLPRYTGDDLEKQVVEKFQKQELAITDVDQQNQFYDKLVDQVPDHYDMSDKSTYASILSGLKKDQMLQNGALYLSDKNLNAKNVRLEVVPIISSINYKRNVAITIRNRAGAEVKTSHVVGKTQLSLLLKLPRNSKYPVYEIEWNFDYSDCTGPANCASAVLSKAYFD